MRQHELFKSIYASNLKSRAVNVMSCLITHMNIKENTCFPSIKTIAKCCSISVNTVKRALDDLAEAGFVEKEARFIEAKNGAQTSNLYRLSAVFCEPDLTSCQNSRVKENAPATDNSEKEYEVITFEDLKDEPNVTEQSADGPALPATERRITVIDKVDRAIFELRHTVNIISASIKIAVPNTQLSCVPP